MISVKRIECPEVLRTGASPESKGELETRKNILLLSDPVGRSCAGAGPKERAVYKAYADKTVRKALIRMFHGKCAYCESRITAIYSGDIEHFRPKGGGYYWLAADWTNLLFACPFCNQTHTHELRSDGGTIEIVQGKLDQFPLLSESHRLNGSHGAIFFSDAPAYQKAFEQEEVHRLLLSPCTDADVESFFKYDDQGVILAGDRLSAIERMKAETSIKVYALQRLGLVLAREARAIQVRAQIKRVEIAINNLSKHFDASVEERIYFEGLLRDEMASLRKFQDPDQEYAGMARYIIRRYFENFG